MGRLVSGEVGFSPDESDGQWTPITLEKETILLGFTREEFDDLFDRILPEKDERVYGCTRCCTRMKEFNQKGKQPMVGQYRFATYDHRKSAWTSNHMDLHRLRCW